MAEPYRERYFEGVMIPCCDKCGVPIPAKICPVCGHQHGPHYDGGSLDLGIIRDEEILRRNNFEIFFEEFEKLLDIEGNQV